jgi:hypothetical protein
MVERDNIGFWSERIQTREEQLQHGQLESKDHRQIRSGKLSSEMRGNVGRRNPFVAKEINPISVSSQGGAKKYAKT